MNVFDYFFVDSKNLDKNFILGVAEKASFKQIYDDSLKLASHLRKMYGEDNKIILLSQNSLFFITAYLGIIKSGNICVPLNPTIEQDNLDYIVGLIDCKLGFISKTIRSILNISSTPRISESDLNDILRTQEIDVDISANGFDENRLAEIIFTSGSTGVPKGVMLSHLNLRTNTNSIIEYLRLSQDDIIEVVLPFFYCYGLSLLHTHLKVGGSVVLNNNFVLLGSVIDNLIKYKCTGFAGVPSHYQILLKKSQIFTKTVFPDLRYVTQAGGKLHNVFIEEFIETFPEIKFYVMYGQTEATARLSFLPPEFLKSKMGSIGKGIPGVTLKVLNEQNKLVEVGEVGELVVKGDNVMSGYFKDPEGTNEVLKDGWLYTGDMARVDEDGFIYLMARKKEILKVGGKRVSPKEIEEVILSVPEVLDCTIEGFDDNLLGEAIKATVVLTGSFDKLEMEDKILKRCREKLSLYKIPHLLEFTEKL
ncbi:MAG TPA: AMP-binding protein, partial [Paludibacter sp.]